MIESRLEITVGKKSLKESAEIRFLLTALQWLFNLPSSGRCASAWFESIRRSARLRAARLRPHIRREPRLVFIDIFAPLDRFADRDRIAMVKAYEPVIAERLQRRFELEL